MSQAVARCLMIPLLRAGVRYAPHSAVRSFLWHRWVEPEIAWRDHVFEAHTAAGLMAGNTRDIIQQYLYYFGIWEPEATAFLNRRLRPGDTFIDVGANIGYFSLLAAKRVGPGGRVIAVEASPPVFERLVSNVNLNHARHVRTLNVAAAAEKGQVKLYCGQDCNCGATSVVPDESDVVIAEVDAAPLTDLISDHDWNSARVVKIDVEGAEAGVIRGLGSLIEKGRIDREYLIEIHPSRLRHLGYSPADVLKPFDDAGYHAYTIGNDYQPATYLLRIQPARPQRWNGEVVDDMNIVFSHEDRTEL